MCLLTQCIRIKLSQGDTDAQSKMIGLDVSSLPSAIALHKERDGHLVRKKLVAAAKNSHATSRELFSDNGMAITMSTRGDCLI